MNADRVIDLNGDVIVDDSGSQPAARSSQLDVSPASLERLQQGLSGLLRRREALAGELRELETAIARQEGGIQLMQLLVDGGEM